MESGMDTERTCIECHETKPLSEFYKRTGLNSYRTSCRLCWNASCLAKYHASPARHKRAVKARYDNFGRFARYGINAEQYDAILLEQGNKCALCPATEPGGKGVWHIDHRHGPDEPKRRKSWKAPPGCIVRGLLCHACNVNLGAYQSLLERCGEARVLAYLTRGRTNTEPSDSAVQLPDHDLRVVAAAD
jgi:hypothetical protein